MSEPLKLARPMANLAVIVGVFAVLRNHIDDNGVRGAIAWTVGPLAVDYLKLLTRPTAQVTP